MVLAKFLSFVAVVALTSAHDACQECDETDCSGPVFDCYTQVRESQFTGYPIVTYYGWPLPNCLEECRTRENCLSVNYYCHDNRCDLNSESANNFPDKVVVNNDATYFERKACGDVQVDYDCFVRVSGSRLTDYFSTVNVDDEEQCTHLCLSVEQLCLAASFDTQTKECFLSDSLDSESDANSELFEKTCNKDCHFTRTANRYLAGYNDYTEDAEDVDECIVKCALRNVEENKCKSAEYQSVLKKCYMSEDTKSVNPTRFRESSSYTYVELDCGEQNTDCLKDYQSSYYAGDTYKYLSGSTEESCRTACSDDINCRSALYAKSRNVCYLNYDGHGDTPLKSNYYYVFFEKTDDC